MDKQRCKWVNMKNPLYVKYHDEEWGVPTYDEHKLYEMFMLETFQAGLSWEGILNKRENFRNAYDNFDIDKVCDYTEEKIARLMADSGIIRNRLKIKASVTNSRIYREISAEYGGFRKYLESFAGTDVICENDRTTNSVSDAISEDLKKRGMKFVGSVTIYSYLQAIGIINSHSDNCFLCAKR